MKQLRSVIAQVARQEDINFLLTTRIPRRWASQFIGWFSRIEQPVVRDLSIATWRMFTELDLSEASEPGFRSLHHCFTRRLRDGARPIDPDPDLLVSPCDAIVGASGNVEGTQVLQIKGFPYQLSDLFGDDETARAHRDGSYVTLRLTSAMYHHFHAPHDLRVERVTRLSGDTWNVNPIALKRIERLFCRNQRAVIRTRLSGSSDALTLVAVAAILVAGIRLSFDDRALGVDDNAGRLAKGEEMGWFEHGSTIIVFAPRGYALCGDVAEGRRIAMGQPLMRMA